MPFNGSGTFTLAEAAFIPNTVIGSTVMNSDLSDIATNGLTNAVTKDGQTTITGAFKGFSGSVGLPMYSFSADPDCGMYRIGANNIGISAGGVKILDISSTGLVVTGSFSPTTTFVAPAGTVSLPSYTFTGDLDTGIYEIGANNIGIAVNATKILDIGTTGLNVIGTVSSNGAAFSPTAQGAGMVNGTIVESHTGNAVTFAIKTLAGADPSATDIVYFIFRNVTAATGNYVVIQVTAALSLTVSSGSTLGTSSSNIPFKLWLVAFNDASTIRLGVINNLSGTSIYPLAQFAIASAVSEGGAGGADLAQTFYANATVTSKAYEILGYASYETGVTTAGNWAASPTRLQLFGAGVKLPGDRVQKSRTQSGAAGSTTNTYTPSATSPTPGGGISVAAQAVTPTSAANLIRVAGQAVLSNGNTSASLTAFIYDTTNSATKAVSGMYCGNTDNAVTTPVSYEGLASVTTAITFTLYGTGTSSTTRVNSTSTVTLFGAISNSFIEVEEIMT